MTIVNLSFVIMVMIHGMTLKHEAASLRSARGVGGGREALTINTTYSIN